MKTTTIPPVQSGEISNRSIKASINCSNCSLINPGSAERCDCGYDFRNGTIEESFVPKSAVVRDRGSAIKGLVIVLWVYLAAVSSVWLMGPIHPFAAGGLVVLALLAVPVLPLFMAGYFLFRGESDTAKGVWIAFLISALVGFFFILWLSTQPPPHLGGRPRRLPYVEVLSADLRRLIQGPREPVVADCFSRAGGGGTRREQS